MIPILAFLTPISLRTAFSAPVALKGSWIFDVIHCGPSQEHLQAVRQWVVLCVNIVTLASAIVFFLMAPAELRDWPILSVQFVLTIGLSVMLTDIFFLRVHQIPFTTVRTPATTDLPISFVRYIVLFPAFVLWLVGRERWMEMDFGHLGVTILIFVSAHAVFRPLTLFYEERHRTDLQTKEMATGYLLRLQE